MSSGGIAGTGRAVPERADRGEHPAHAQAGKEKSASRAERATAMEWR
jgi:hypothetical protein